MKTEVIMKRELFGSEISQKSKSEFFSATDLMRAGNKWRINNNLQPMDLTEWFRNKKTKEFIEKLEGKYGNVKISGRGRGTHTWVHPFLFIDLALALSPELKIEVYEWLYDELIRYRNSSGNSYKKMAGSLYLNINNKSLFNQQVIDIANRIKIECNVKNWEIATEAQLKLRDKIHENIALLCDVLNDNEQAVKIGILKAKEENIGHQGEK